MRGKQIERDVNTSLTDKEKSERLISLIHFFCLSHPISLLYPFLSLRSKDLGTSHGDLSPEHQEIGRRKDKRAPRVISLSLSLSLSPKYRSLMHFIRQLFLSLLPSRFPSLSFSLSSFIRSFSLLPLSFFFSLSFSLSLS
jgi:hypothetical protein